MSHHKRKMQSTLPETQAKREAKQRACEAVDAMQANRPLRGPPLRHETQMCTAGAIALARDKKSGAYEELRSIDFALERPHSTGYDGSHMPTFKVIA
jgi:hypothetical protein